MVNGKVYCYTYQQTGLNWSEGVTGGVITAQKQFQYVRTWRDVY